MGGGKEPTVRECSPPRSRDAVGLPAVSWAFITQGGESGVPCIKLAPRRPLSRAASVSVGRGDKQPRDLSALVGAAPVLGAAGGMCLPSAGGEADGRQ